MSAPVTGRKTHKLTKIVPDGELSVLVTPCEERDEVRIYTYGTWTDYTTRIEETLTQARATWARLVADGFVWVESYYRTDAV